MTPPALLACQVRPSPSSLLHRRPPLARYIGIISSDARGSIAGVTLTRGRNGSNMRSKVSPVNPQTTAQALRRGQLAGYSGAWKSTDPTVITAWQQLANQITYTNSLGQQYHPSGQQLYLGCRANLALLSSFAPPTPPSIPPTPPVITTLGGTLKPNNVLLNWTLYGTATDWQMVSYASRPVSRGVTYFSINDARFMAHTNASSLSVDLTNRYSQVFGQIPTGAKIFLWAFLVQSSTGIAGAVTSTWAAG